MDIAPKVIRLTKANGDFYEGVVLAVTNDGIERVRMFVTKSNVDGLTGEVEASFTVTMPLAGLAAETVSGDSGRGGEAMRRAIIRDIATDRRRFKEESATWRAYGFCISMAEEAEVS